MVNANELRLGNWMFFDSDSFPEQVRMESFAILYKYPERINSIKPIPLTPEILEKCGFYDKLELRLQIGEHDYPEEVLHIVWHEDLKMCRLENRDEGFRFANPIKYLHQLQNLYFALTGNELKINL